MRWTAFSLFLFYLLYHFRSLDDSRVSGWQDVFAVIHPLKTALALVAALILAFAVSRSSFVERKPALFLFVLSFMGAACFWSEPELIADASRYFTQAKHLEIYGISHFFLEWGAGISTWTDLPAVPFLYGMVFSIFGESRTAIQLLNAVLFSSAVVLTYLTGRELWNREIGLYGGMFLLGIPYLYTQVPLMLVDVPSMAFLMLAVYTFILALRKGGVMIAAAGVSLFFAFFTKYSMWLMLTVIAVIYIAELYRNRRNAPDRYALRGMIVFFTACFLIFVAIAFMHDEMMQQIHLLLTYQKPGLLRWGESFFAIFLFQVHPAVTLLAAASVYFAIRQKDPAYIITAWLVMLVIVLQIRRIRYLILAFPMLCLMAAYGAVQLRKVLNPRFMVFSTAACSFVMALTAFLPFQQSTSAQNIRDAASYLDSLDLQTVEVMTPMPGTYIMNPSASVPVLDLFLRTRLHYRYTESAYPLPEDLETSALRFTWTYKNPPYYAAQGKNEKRAVAVITDSAGSNLPEEIRNQLKNYAQSRTFSLRDTAYQHQTLVTVYH